MKNHAYRTEKNQRVVTFLNRQEVDFLDKLGKDALFTTGVKLSRSKLIAWLVDFSKELNMSGKDIKSEIDFEERIHTIIKNEWLKNPHLPRKGQQK